MLACVCIFASVGVLAVAQLLVLLSAKGEETKKSKRKLLKCPSGERMCIHYVYTILFTTGF